MELDAPSLEKVYSYLKSYAYYENLNLFLKQTVSDFECSDFDLRMKNLLDVLNDENTASNPTFTKWLEDINFSLLPKGAKRAEDEQQNKHNKHNKHNKEKGLFLSNVTKSYEYEVNKLNYFIVAPAELHIIEMLWCLVVGPALENDLNESCYGNRMSEGAHSFGKSLYSDVETGKSEIFKMYFDQYSLWRDQALDKATEISKNGEDVAFLSLDLKSYFYEIDINFDKVKKSIICFTTPELSDFAVKLTDLLEEIYSSYHSKIKPLLNITHPKSSNKQGLPIGLASSAIPANWYLEEFDSLVVNKVRPEYYGRYVDDILMVFKQPKIEKQNQIESFINAYLNGLIVKSQSSTEYEVRVENTALPLQRDKLILQFFDKEHSRAGLEVFKKEIEERSSAFRFLPEDHVDNELDKFAYDILYDGSANKLRSVVGLAENETELAKYLSSHIMAHRLSQLDKKDVVLPQLLIFFNGINSIVYSRLWEKVYQYAVILENSQFVVEFYRLVEREIDKLCFNVNEAYATNEDLIKITEKLKYDIKHYNKLSLSLCLGLLDVEPYERQTEQEHINAIFSDKRINVDSLPIDEWPTTEGLSGLALFAFYKELNPLVRNLRKANMIRHSLVAWPLANFTSYSGNLTQDDRFLQSKVTTLDDKKVTFSPRFINFDEYQIFHLNLALLQGNSLDNWQKESISGYTDLSKWKNIFVSWEASTEKSSEFIHVNELVVGNKIERKTLKLALTNICIQEKDIEDAVRKDKTPNVSFTRQLKLFQLLNSALKEKAELLILPEVSIPVSWLPFMVSYARRNQIGIVFGLEHWVIDGKAYNLLIEALPYKLNGKYNSCAVTARIKNHYAPAELDMLNSLRISPGNETLADKNNYHRVLWNGISLATYNCFELSDIEHRSIFKSHIDLLIACVWNKDTNYYQHILESAVRDIHSYVAQSNTSQYGGSCVLRPTKTESKTMLYVKGGENTCVLTVDIDIEDLRSFQFKSKPNTKDRFKHLPPGYVSENVLKR